MRLRGNVLVFLGILTLVQCGLCQSGVPDATFNVSVNGDVFAIAVQPDQRILIGGTFTEVNGEPRSRLARLNSDGSLDSTWTSSQEGFVYRIVVSAGKVFVGSSSCVRRFDADGALEREYPFLTEAFGVDASQRVIIGGAFTFLDGRYHRLLARVNADGSVDNAFAPEIGMSSGEYVRAIGFQGDQLLIGGRFQRIDRTNDYANIGRINPDGSVDTTFGAVGAEEVVAFAPTVGNGFYRASLHILARHLSDGSEDPAFTLVTTGGLFDNQFEAVVAQADGKPIAGGRIGLRVDGNLTTKYLARFTQAGMLDSSFSTELDAPVNAIALQQDGRIIIGGSFTMVNGIPQARLARLLGDVPPIDVQRIKGGKIVISWPAAYSGWLLQGTKNLKQDKWNFVKEQPVVVDGVNVVTTRASSGKHFRLVQHDQKRRSNQ